MKLNQNFLKFGLGAMVVMAATAFLSGFQGNQDKIGVVDLNKIISESDMGKASTKELQDALTQRSTILDFISMYRVLTTDQANKLKDLTLKPNRTEAETKELDRIKEEVKAADKKRNELLQKANMTDADRLALQDYSQRSQTMQQLVERWNSEFQQELNLLETTVRERTLNKAKDTVKQVAKSQGFTLVLESSVAPYAANDITEPSIKALNAAK